MRHASTTGRRSIGCTRSVRERSSRVLIAGLVCLASSVVSASPLQESPGAVQPTSVEIRLARDQEALRARISALESSGNHTRLMARVEALQTGLPREFIFLDEWAVAWHELKFVHAIRDAGWPEQSLASLQDTEPNLWPHPGTADEAEQALETRLARHLGWTS